MATRRKSSGKQRGDNDDMNVRFDYSTAYLDNDFLNSELEDKEFELWREQQRACVETNESIKKAKKDADDMLHLKDAVKKRDPNESTNRVVKSADYKKRQTSTGESKLNNKTSENSAVKSNKAAESDKTGVKSDESTDVDGPIKMTENANKTDNKTFNAKPLNTLTMFLLSIQNFKKAGNQSSKNESLKNGKKGPPALPEALQKANNESKNKKSDKGRELEKGELSKLSTRPASYHAGQSRAAEQTQGDDKRAQSQYGIHARKDFTRSRRKLEEISRIEQDSRYGPVNRYEERRRKLLVACKDTASLDDRIKHFLKDIDEFNTISRNENTLEKVLLRTKSARVSRATSFAW